MGACAITVNDSIDVGGHTKMTRGTLSLSTSYATNGDTVSISQLGLPNSLYVIFHEYQRSGILFEYNYTSNLLRAMYPQGLNTPTGTSIATMTYSSVPPTGAVTVNSTSAQPACFGAMTAGQCIEVQNTANLSTITLRFVAFGY